MQLFKKFLINKSHIGFLKSNLTNINNQFMMGLKKKITVINIDKSVNSLLSFFIFLKNLISGQGRILIINLDPEWEEWFEKLKNKNSCVYMQGWHVGAFTNHYIADKIKGSPSLPAVDFVIVFNLCNLNISLAELNKFDVPVFMICDSNSPVNKISYWAHGSTSIDRSLAFLLNVIMESITIFSFDSDRVFKLKKNKYSKLVTKKNYSYIYGFKKKKIYKKYKTWNFKNIRSTMMMTPRLRSMMNKKK